MKVREIVKGKEKAKEFVVSDRTIEVPESDFNKKSEDLNCIEDCYMFSPDTKWTIFWFEIEDCELKNPVKEWKIRNHKLNKYNSDMIKAIEEGLKEYGFFGIERGFCFDTSENLIKQQTTYPGIDLKEYPIWVTNEYYDEVPDGFNSVEEAINNLLNNEFLFI